MLTRASFLVPLPGLVRHARRGAKYRPVVAPIDRAGRREVRARDAGARQERSGANVKQMLRPLVAAWELAPYVTAQWTGVCENAQRYLSNR
jgi:hypothetical protein